jgi:putative NADH-flavin reductase
MNRMDAVLCRVGAGLLLLLTLGAAPSAAAGTHIVIYGATGAIGSLITQEALNRGDIVTGVARDPGKLTISNPNYTAVAGDVTDLDSFKRVTKGADAVIITVLDSGANAPENSVMALAAKTAVAAYTGVAHSPHIIQIGAAPTIYGSKEALLAHVHIPPSNPMYGIVLGHMAALQTYQASHINWTVLTPPNNIQGWTMGQPPVPHRTGKYRTATTELVTDAQGQSAINVADLAVAAVDEAEHPQFVGKRFTVGY